MSDIPTIRSPEIASGGITSTSAPADPIHNSTSNIQNSAPASSYGQILRSSSIVGGASGINYLVGMVRTKLVAVLLGPSGVGLVGLYVSVTGMVGTIAGLGIGTSGVREVAMANGAKDPARIAQTVTALRRLCWITGFFGWLLAVALALPLSRWIFGSGDYVRGIAILGATVLLGAISGGQSALIQGVRRIGDLARIQVIGVILNTVVAVGLYAWLRQKGIVPVLLATAGIQMLVSWHFARKIQIAGISQSIRETIGHAKRFVTLGAAFMVSGVLGTVVALAIRAVIVRELGLDANGMYQAAWGISGLFAGFILGAMGADFYPRLTEAAGDPTRMNQLINEQTEIGILLAFPGLLGTLTFAPWVMHVFYSAKFLPAAELLPWFVLGVFGQVVSWPMGFALIAKGASGWFLFVETLANVLKLGLSVVLLHRLGLWGIALAMPLLYVFHTVLLLVLCRSLTGFRWTAATQRLLALSGALIGVGFVAIHCLSGPLAICLGALLTAASGLISLRGISSRLGQEHRLVKMACRFPGGRFACGV